MARRCDTASYRALVAAARAAIPELTLTTDLIVGFPGETDAEWNATRSFVQEIGFGHIHIFTYSPRQGTKAARLAGHLPKETKRARSREIHDMAAQMKATHLTRQLQRTRPGLWEGDPIATDDGDLVWQGYTDNYLRVTTTTPASINLENVIEAVHLIDVVNETLVGKRVR